VACCQLISFEYFKNETRVSSLEATPISDATGGGEIPGKKV
jgi:hypothetical protein